MKTIGLIGGMSWESTLEYYRIINEEIRDRRGGDHSGELAIYSFDFNKIVEFQNQEKWDELESMMTEAGKGLKEAGADFLLICANTMHRRAEDVEESVDLPLIHIGDAVAEDIKKKGLSSVGLLGTKYVMEADFYREKLKEHGLKTIVPKEDERAEIHEIIYKELCRGVVKQSSKNKILKMIDDLNERGAEGIILGCTELPIHITEEDVDIPLFDSTRLHAEAAVERALEK